MRQILIWSIILFFAVKQGYGQKKPFAEKIKEGYHPLTLNLTKDGSKFIRFITWHQVWLTVQNNSNNEVQADLMLRRSRLLAYAQISPRFLILTHFGVNSVSTNTMHPTGQSPQVSLFMHDAWIEYTILPKYLSIGAGLHYWNGISRLTNQSTLKIMTIDAPRFNWPSIGTTDQFARHLGIYAKGQIAGFDYRISVNQALRNTLDASIAPAINQATYQNNGGFVYSGYFMYQIFDKESNKLPYLTGTYLGKKKVLNVGAGFNVHPKGSMSLEQNGDTITHDVSLFGVDIYYDTPLGEKAGALTAYLVYYRYNFGPNYRLGGSSDLVGTGNIFYGQFGYLIPTFSDKINLQIYAAFSYRQLDAFSQGANTITGGLNCYLLNHAAKVSLEYQNNQPAAAGTTRQNLFRIQAAVFI